MPLPAWTEGRSTELIDASPNELAAYFQSPQYRALSPQEQRQVREDLRRGVQAHHVQASAQAAEQARARITTHAELTAWISSSEGQALPPRERSRIYAEVSQELDRKAASRPPEPSGPTLASPGWGGSR